MNSSSPLKNVSSIVQPKRIEPTTDAHDEERSFDLGDFLAILRRRKFALLIPILILFGISIIVAWSLPKMYRSTATILVEQQEIPTSYVSSTVSTFADRRIQMITQRVLTTANLTKVIKKFSLEREFGKNTPVDLIADNVRRNFKVSRVGASGGTVAFSISYDSRSPTIAQAVATELTSGYLEENLKIRTESAEDTTGFLTAEADRLGSEINALEARIAAFKETHMGRLPEQLGLNLQLMGRTEQRIDAIEQQLRTLEDRKIYLEIAMAQLKSNPQGGPNQTAVQLQALRTQLQGLLAVYTPNHPDVARLQTEIAALETLVVKQSGVTTIERELTTRRAELTQALSRYSKEHPDVKNLEQQVTDLETAVKQANVTNNATSTNSSSNFSYLDRQAQYRAAEKEMTALRAERTELKEKLSSYITRIEQTPHLEREYSLLIRDRDNLMAKYREIRSKMSSARVAENLEKANKGERFSLIEPARLPVKPYKPNRKKILALGMVASVGAGIGAATLSEFLNKGVYGARGVSLLLGQPPLALIPYIKGPLDRRRLLAKLAMFGFLILIIVSMSAAYVHMQIVPLEQLWNKSLAQLEVYLSTLIDRVRMLLNTYTSFF